MTYRCSDKAPRDSLLQFNTNSNDSLTFTINLFIIQENIGMLPLVEEEDTPANPDFYSIKLHQLPGRMNHTVSIRISP